jgi:antirestriction protein ArdC
MTDPSVAADAATSTNGRLARMVADRTAPWMRAWKPLEAAEAFPTNPVTGCLLGGADAMALLGRRDPRWYSIDDIKALGLGIRPGTRGVPVEFWKFGGSVKAVSPDGLPVLDQDGEEVFRQVMLERPMVKHAHVFNAADLTLEGGRPLPPPDKGRYRRGAPGPAERGTRLVDGSGARVVHDQAENSFYSPLTDSVHVRPREAFGDPLSFLAAVLHEIGHWTSHRTRLDRNFGHKGSPDHAKEELRAEMASWLVAVETGLPHAPSPDGFHHKCWAQDAADDPDGIRRAFVDARKIVGYLLERENTGQWRIPRPHVIPTRQSI